MSTSHPLPVDPGSDPSLRLSDRERDAVAEFLRVQNGEGRLTMVELEDRLDQVYKAKVRADLEGVGEGLPLPSTVPSSQVERARPTAPRPMRSVAPTTDAARAFAVHFRTWLIFSVFFTLIYLVTDAGGYFWPIWPIMGWGVGVATHWSSCRR